MGWLKTNLAWIGACAILIVITFFGTWIWEGNKKDKEFAALSGHKDTVIVNVPVVLPPKDTTVIGTVMPIKPSMKRELDSLRNIADAYFKLQNDSSDAADEYRQAVNRLYERSSWLSQSFFKTIVDTRGKRNIIVDPEIKSIEEIFYEDTIHVDVPQVNTTFTRTTGITTATAIEIGCGGVLIGGGIAKDKTAIAVGAGGIVLVELLKMIF